MKEDNWHIYAGQLRGIMSNIPLNVVVNRELDDVPMEYRMRISKFLEKYIDENVKRVRQEHDLPLDK